MKDFDAAYRQAMTDLGYIPKAKPFRTLMRAYRDRPYHSLDHVMATLEFAEKAGTELSQKAKAQVALALLFHDIVYNSQSSMNEEDSARVAADHLAHCKVSEEDIQEIGRLILLTKGHSTDKNDSSGQVVVDADLSVLGADSEAYRKYAAGVRKEYSWVSDYKFSTARVLILTQFLKLAEQENLFKTKLGKERNYVAFQNLSWEISVLETMRLKAATGSTTG